MRNRQRTKKAILYLCAALFLIGGAMGILKSLFPSFGWLSFRALLFGAEPLAYNIPAYIRVYSIAMGAFEILAAIAIFIRKKNRFLWIEILIAVNMAGCAAAVFMGDAFALVSLLLRLAPLSIIDQERRKWAVSKTGCASNRCA